MADRSFRRFQAWQSCHSLTIHTYQATSLWPAHERFGLIAQARRAAVSAELNIAEGAAKRGPAEFARFLDISQGSLNELECLFEVARDVGCLDAPAWRRLESRRHVAARAVVRLYQAMRRAAGEKGRPLSSAAAIGRSTAADR